MKYLLYTGMILIPLLTHGQLPSKFETISNAWRFQHTQLALKDEWGKKEIEHPGKRNEILVNPSGLHPGFLFPVSDTTENSPGPKAEIFSGGLIDIVQNGQMNASARLFRLFIGEPGKFQLPLSLFTGVSASNFSNPGNNDDILQAMIDPATGIFNLSLDGQSRLAGKKQSITSLHFQYQAGLRFLSIYDRVRFVNTTLLNHIYGAGVCFFTGAWEKNRINNLGLFWLNLRLLFSRNPARALAALLTDKVNPAFWAYSAGTGIEISQALNVRIFYFRFFNNQQSEPFRQPFLQLSLNYSLQ